MGDAVWIPDALFRGDRMTQWEQFYYGVVAVVLIFGTAILGACASIEGDGFGNGGSGYRGVKLCKQTTRTGERWFRC